jgi:23S rRNA (cytosine1962-C5)-methyltransferase
LAERRNRRSARLAADPPDRRASRSRTHPAPDRATNLARAVDEAKAFRGASAEATDACLRIFAGAPDGVPGLVIDRFGRLVVATAYDPGLDPGALSGIAETAFPSCRVLVRSRDAGGQGWDVRTAGDRTVPDVLVAEEAGLRFEVRCDPRHDFGLFPDAAAARARLRTVAGGLHVLNLFSYACAFAVAACAGGAASVTNVDPGREYLAWGLRNAALNGCAFRVLPDTAQTFLRRHLRRTRAGTADRRFEAIVADPPAFGVGRGDARILRKFWPELLATMAELAPRHVLLLCSDKALRGYEDFQKNVRDALGRAYALAEVPVGPAVAGRRPERRDPWYEPPLVVHAVRTEA